MIHIVIVNWNAGSLLRSCLASVARWGSANTSRLIVVDNGSTDGSTEIEMPELPLEIVRTGENLGFAKACNLGAKGAEAPYLLFLNPDTELREDAFGPVLAFMESPEAVRVGICGIRLIGESGEVQRHCARFPTWRSFVGNGLGLTWMAPRAFPPVAMEEFDHLATRPVDHVIGAFYLIRRELFESLGGFDERFFVYLEDLDLSRRASLADWRTMYLAEPFAYHKGGGTSEQVKAHRLFYSLRSRLLYAFKHFRRSAAWGVMASTLAVEPVSRLTLALVHRSSDEARATLSGYCMLLRDMPRILRTIRRQSARSPAAPDRASG